MITIREVEFSISCVGEVTGEQYAGNFKARQVLSHSLQLEQDRLRREFLGPQNQENASQRAQNQAKILSEIAVRLTDAPPFWKGSRNGLDLLDDRPIGAVYDGVLKVEADYLAEVQARAEEAKKQLEKSQASK